MSFGIIILILLLSFVLIKSADYVVVSLRKLGKQTRAGTFTVSAILLALGTSFPELFVGITSAFEQASNLTLGVIIGSNIANVSLVVGLGALIAGKVKVQGGFLKRDVWIALIAGLLPIILVLDGQLTKIDGLILIVMYFAYATSLFKRRFEEIGEEGYEKEGFLYRFLNREIDIDGDTTKEMGKLFIGIAMLLFSADMIVRLSMNLAEAIGIPIFLVGLIIIAIGTSLPELAFSIRSIKSHEPKMFFGNILGSVIANSTLVIGISVFIYPISVAVTNGYLTAALAFIVIYLTFWYFIRSKHRLDRWEGVVLIVLYFAFIAIEILKY